MKRKKNSWKMYYWKESKGESSREKNLNRKKEK